MVIPVTDYGSRVWNLSNHKCIDDLQFRTLRYFMGVYKYYPLLGLEGDGSLDSLKTRIDVNVL